jgi:glutathione synthase/RimK-type ligase-like ATP-grasp enzyme
MTVVFATDSNLGSDEDFELKRLLEEEYETEVHLVDWRAESAQQELFEQLEDTPFIVVIRSTWDYHLHADEFKRWLHKLEEIQIHVFNSCDLITWNMHKQYLFELNDWGLPTVRTAPLTQELEITKFFDLFQCTELVIKPCTSAGSHNTIRVNKAQCESEKLEKLKQKLASWMQDGAEFIVQPFMEEITTLGEISLLFINQEFSHALLKKPRSGDWLVQQQYGGTAEPYKCDAKVLELAQRAVENIRYKKNDGKPILYTRVDLIPVKNDGTESSQYLISEIELIEPYFFFHTAPEPSVAYHTFVNAIQDKLEEL